MKKIIALLFLLSITPLSFAQDAKTVFANIPDSLLPLLTAVNRADFIDFIESDMVAKVKNKLEGESEMTNLTASYIHIKTTGKSVWQMKLLPSSENEKVVCVVTTACAPVCDSSVKFYTTGWKELPTAQYLILPTADDFFQNPSPDQPNELNRLKQKADMFLLKAELDADTDHLLFTYTTPQYQEKSDQEKIKPYLQSPLTFRWNGVKFAR